MRKNLFTFTRNSYKSVLTKCKIPKFELVTLAGIKPATESSEFLNSHAESPKNKLTNTILVA